MVIPEPSLDTINSKTMGLSLHKTVPITLETRENYVCLEKRKRRKRTNQSPGS